MSRSLKFIFIVTTLVLIAFAAWWFLLRNTNTASNAITVQPIVGALDITVHTTGELQALNSEDIRGPDGLRFIGINQVKISELIPEGSIVKEGDFIAMLDPSQLNTKIKDAETELQKVESQYLQTRLDTTLELRKLRDDLINQYYDLEQKQIAMEQSKFESPATIRQIEIELEKAKRTYTQAKRNYKIKKEQFKAKMQEVNAVRQVQQSKLDQMNAMLDQFRISAPKAGMLIYKKDWSGRKVKGGSDIYSFDPTVATLPDMSTMISRCYVNEIDINKVKVGQIATMTVDAFPDRKFKGKVSSVANVGEELPDNDTKVFEVVVELIDRDTLLKPAMTTNTTIATATLSNTTLHIPQLCIQGNDSLTYVYVERSGKRIKQEVITGAAGNDRIEIRAGISKTDQVYMNVPDDKDNIQIERISEAERKKFAPKQYTKPVQNDTTTNKDRMMEMKPSENEKGNGRGNKGNKPKVLGMRGGGQRGGRP